MIPIFCACLSSLKLKWPHPCVPQSTEWSLGCCAPSQGGVEISSFKRANFSAQDHKTIPDFLEGQAQGHHTDKKTIPNTFSAAQRQVQGIARQH